MENSNQHENNAILAQVTKEEYSGIIPHPDIMVGYENILPGATDRILTLAEKQVEHRIESQKFVLRTNARDSLLGIISALGLGIGTLIGGVVIALNIPSAAGTISGSVFGVTGIVAIIATFLKGTRTDYKNDNDK